MQTFELNQLGLLSFLALCMPTGEPTGVLTGACAHLEVLFNYDLSLFSSRFFSFVCVRKFATVSR